MHAVFNQSFFHNINLIWIQIIDNVVLSLYFNKFKKPNVYIIPLKAIQILFRNTLSNTLLFFKRRFLPNKLLRLRWGPK